MDLNNKKRFHRTLSLNKIQIKQSLTHLSNTKMLINLQLEKYQKLRKRSMEHPFFQRRKTDPKPFKTVLTAQTYFVKNKKFINKNNLRVKTLATPYAIKPKKKSFQVQVKEIKRKSKTPIDQAKLVFNNINFKLKTKLQRKSEKKSNFLIRFHTTQQSMKSFHMKPELFTKKSVFHCSEKENFEDNSYNQPLHQNYCDYYLINSIRYCFMGSLQYYRRSEYLRLAKLKYTTYEVITEKLVILQNKYKESFVINKGVFDFGKIIKLKLKAKRKKKAKSSEIDSLKVKPRFESLGKRCSIDQRLHSESKKKPGKKKKARRRLYISRWIKLVESLLHEHDFDKLNYIGYYDIKLGKNKKHLKYLIMDNSLGISHIAFMIEKLKEDLIFEQNKKK